jgi:ATP-binding cassette subfamily C protein
LILLDEPNANLDPDGEEALCSAIQSAKARGAASVIVTHRPRLLTIADAVLLLRDGSQTAFGPPFEVLRAQRPASVPNPPALPRNAEPQKLAGGRAVP